VVAGFETPDHAIDSSALSGRVGANRKDAGWSLYNAVAIFNTLSVLATCLTRAYEAVERAHNRRV
jgi:hypothetical protein